MGMSAVVPNRIDGSNLSTMVCFNTQWTLHHPTALAVATVACHDMACNRMQGKIPDSHVTAAVTKNLVNCVLISPECSYALSVPACVDSRPLLLFV